MSDKLVFRVIYDIKEMSKTSNRYGVLTTKISKFPTLKSATIFARSLYGKKTDDLVVIGMPIIERLTG